MGRAVGASKALPSRKNKPPALPHTTRVLADGRRRPGPEPEPEALPSRKKNPPALPHTTREPEPEALPSRKRKPPALSRTTQALARVPEPEPEAEPEETNRTAKRPPSRLPASQVKSDHAAGEIDKKLPPPPLPIVKRSPPPLPTAEEVQQFREAQALEPQSAAELEVWELVHVANREAAKGIFNAADVDQSGAMDLDEVRAVIERRCPGADKEYVEELIERFDRDGNGALDLEEFEDLYTLVLKTAVPAQVCFPPWFGGPWFEGRGLSGFCEWILAIGRSVNHAGTAILVAFVVSLVLFVALAAHCCPAAGVEPMDVGCGGSPVRLQEGFLLAAEVAEDQCPVSVHPENTCVDGGFSETLHSEPNVDIVFLTDQSSSMDLFNQRLEANFHAFIGELDKYTTYWHIIVANTNDGCLINEGHVLTHETQDFEGKFVEAVRKWHYDGGRDADAPGKHPRGPEPVFPWTQALLTPAVRAVQPDMVGPGGCNEGFLREDALLHVVIVSDETEQGRDWSYHIGDERTFRPSWELALDELVRAKGGRSDMVEISGFTSHVPHLQHDPNPTCTGVPLACRPTDTTESKCRRANGDRINSDPLHGSCQAANGEEPTCTDGYTAIRSDCFDHHNDACAAADYCQIHLPAQSTDPDVDPDGDGLVSRADYDVNDPTGYIAAERTMSHVHAESNGRPEEVHAGSRRSRCYTEARFRGINVNTMGNFRCCLSSEADIVDNRVTGSECEGAFASHHPDQSVQACPIGCHYAMNGNSLDGCVCNLGTASWDPASGEPRPLGFEAHLTQSDCDVCQENQRWSRCNINKYFKMYLDQSETCTQRKPPDWQLGQPPVSGNILINAPSPPQTPLPNAGPCDTCSPRDDNLWVVDVQSWSSRTDPTLEDVTDDTEPYEWSWTLQEARVDQATCQAQDNTRWEKLFLKALNDRSQMAVNPSYDQSGKPCSGCGWCSRHGKCMCELGAYGYKQAIAGRSADGARQITRPGLDADISKTNWEAEGYIRILAEKSSPYTGYYRVAGLPSEYLDLTVTLGGDQLQGPKTYRALPNPFCTDTGVSCNFDVIWGDDDSAMLYINPQLLNGRSGPIVVSWTVQRDRPRNTCRLQTCEEENEPTCQSRSYTPGKCRFARCSMALFPPLLAGAVGICMLYWFPDVFFSEHKQRIEQTKLVRAALLCGLLLVAIGLATIYVLFFSCCGQNDCEHKDLWESSPWVVVTADGGLQALGRLPTEAYAILHMDSNLRLSPSESIIGIAKFVNGSTGVDVSIEIRSISSVGPPATSGHSWHVHESIVAESACSTAGGHYDPHGVEVDSDGDGAVSPAEYAAGGPTQVGCSQSLQSECYAGDLTGKFGSVNTDGVVISGTDSVLTMEELLSGRSVVVHDNAGGDVSGTPGRRILCGRIRAGAWDEPSTNLLPVDTTASWNEGGSLRVTQCPVVTNSSWGVAVKGRLCEPEPADAGRRLSSTSTVDVRSSSRHVFENTTTNITRRLQAQGVSTAVPNIDCAEDFGPWTTNCGCFDSPATQTRSWRISSAAVGNGVPCTSPAPAPETRSCPTSPTHNVWNCQAGWSGWSRCSASGGECKQTRSWGGSGPGPCGGNACTAADLVPPPDEPSEQICAGPAACCPTLGACCGHWESLPCVCESHNGQFRGRRGRQWVVDLGSFVQGRADNGNCPGANGYEEPGYRENCNLNGPIPCCPTNAVCCGHWELLPCVCENHNGQWRGRRGRQWVVDSGTFVEGRAGNGNCPGADGSEDSAWRENCNPDGPCCPGGLQHPVEGPVRLGIGVQCCIDTQVHTIPEFATSDYRLPPCPRDCIGEWSCWGPCSASCGGGWQTRVYSHVQAADHGGVQCPYPDGYVEERCCNEQDCSECGLAACTLGPDARPNPKLTWPESCCCWSAWSWTFVALLPLGLGLLKVCREPEPWDFKQCLRPLCAPATSEPDPDFDPGPEPEQEEEYTMWIIFLIDPSGTRHAVEVMSTEFSVDTIYQKAVSATGIAIQDQRLQFGGRELKAGKQLTSYGVQHGSELTIELRQGASGETRQSKAARRKITATKGRQAI